MCNLQPKRYIQLYIEVYIFLLLNRFFLLELNIQFCFSLCIFVNLYYILCLIINKKKLNCKNIQKINYLNLNKHTCIRIPKNNEIREIGNLWNPFFSDGFFYCTFLISLSRRRQRFRFVLRKLIHTSTFSICTNTLMQHFEYWFNIFSFTLPAASNWSIFPITFYLCKRFTVENFGALCNWFDFNFSLKNNYNWYSKKLKI